MSREKKATLKQKEARVKFALAAYKNIPFEVEERMYEALPDMLGSVETAEEIIADIVSMFHLERYKVPEHPFIELEKSIGASNFTELMLSLLRAVAQDENSEVSDYIHDMGYKTPGTFINAIKRMSYLLPEKEFEDALKGTRFEIKPKKVKLERPLVEEMPKVPKVSPEQEIYTKLDALLREILRGYRLAEDVIHSEAEAWKYDLEDISKEVAEGGRTQEDAERWLKEQLELLKEVKVEVVKPPYFKPVGVPKPIEPVSLVEVPEPLREFTVPEGILITDITYKEERRRATRLFLTHYWSEIVTYGLSSFFEAHPEFGVRHPTRELLNTFIEVAYEMAQLKYEGKHLYEWVISQAPAAKATIGLMLMEGVHGDRFQDWFINEHYPAHIREEARRIKPTITARGFMDTFKTGVTELSL